MTVAPGRMLSHYRLDSELGRGGMGVVYRAHDTRLDRPVAVKVLPPDLVADRERRRRFVREARAAAAVNHPNIATIHEIGETGGTTFIVMELVQGRSLRRLLKEGRPGITESLEMASQVAAGLARAHQAGIIHRDLKPDNIMVAPDGHVKILDFGLAKLAEKRDALHRSEVSHLETASEPVTREGKVVGTAAYMSPEQARGRTVDARSDIFSFGIVLYEMLAGRLPFQGPTWMDTMAAVLDRDADPVSSVNPEVPRDLEFIVSKCLQKAPGDRYGSADELSADLASVLRGSAPAVNPRDELRLICSRLVLARTPGELRRERVAIEDYLRRHPGDPEALDIQERIHAALDTADPADAAGIPHAGAASDDRSLLPARHRWVLPGAGGLLLAVAIALTWPALGPRLARVLAPDRTAGLDGLRGVPGTAASEIRSIAVLPFEHIGTDPAQSGHLALGLASELTSKLNLLAGLSVTPWITTRRYRDLTRPIEEIASELNVDAVMVGHFRTDEDRIRGSVAMISAARGHQVWTHEFDEAAEDLFALQSRIALAAATQLRGSLSGEEAHGLALPATQSLEAYQLFWRGSELFQAEDPESADRALRLFQEALDLDPGFVDALVGIGGIYTDQYYYGWSGGPEKLDEALRMHRRALEIRPGHLPAIRGLMRAYMQQGRGEEILRLGAEVAASGRADEETLLARAEAYFMGGLPPKALPLLDRILQMDPASQTAAWFRVYARLWARRFEETIAAGEEFFSRFGEEATVHGLVGQALHALGEQEEAEYHYEAAIRPGTNDELWGLIQLGLALRQMGDHETARELFTRGAEIGERMLQRVPENDRVRLFYIYYLAALGDSRAVEREHPGLGRTGTHYIALSWPAFAMLGELERAVRLLELGLETPLGDLPYPEIHIPVFGAGSLTELDSYRQFIRERDRIMAGLRDRF